MIFPKPLMSVRELVNFGFSENYLLNIYRVKGYPIAFKEGGNTGAIKFVTRELDKYIANEDRKRKERTGLGD